MRTLIRGSNVIKRWNSCKASTPPRLISKADVLKLLQIENGEYESIIRPTHIGGVDVSYLRSICMKDIEAIRTKLSQYKASAYIKRVDQVLSFLTEKFSMQVDSICKEVQNSKLSYSMYMKMVRNRVHTTNQLVKGTRGQISSYIQILQRNRQSMFCSWADLLLVIDKIHHELKMLLENNALKVKDVEEVINDQDVLRYLDVLVQIYRNPHYRKPILWQMCRDMRAQYRRVMPDIISVQPDQLKPLQHSVVIPSNIELMNNPKMLDDLNVSLLVDQLCQGKEDSATSNDDDSASIPIVLQLLESSAPPLISSSSVAKESD